jgi:hypothetical protein
MPYFKQLIKAMTNWEKEIFSYFNMPISNAYTESLNNLIKVTNKIGRGYSFEALRAKILFTEGYRKTKKRKRSSKMSILHSGKCSTSHYIFNHLLMIGSMKKFMVLTFPHWLRQWKRVPCSPLSTR